MKFIAGCDIKEIAGQFGTPLYIYDEKRIADNYFRLQYAFKQYYHDTVIHYSVKANSNLFLLKILNSLGAGADTSSPFEVKMARHAGFSDKKILYTGNYESMDDLSVVSGSGITINLDDINSFKRLIRSGVPERISFRINPGIGRGGFEGITTGGTDAKFGIPYEKAFDAYQFAREAGVKRFGIHMMTGSNNLEPYHFAEVTEKLMKIAGSIFNRLGVSPEYVDIGGGFGVPYTDEEQPLNIDETARLISEIIIERTKKYGFEPFQLILEPGRYLIADAGFLVTNISGIKKSYKTFIGLDAGMNVLIRQAFYGAHHRISIYDKETLENIVTVCGNICENSDIFEKNLFLPNVEEDDLLIFTDAGAYGYAMSSNYNGRARPAEVLINKTGEPFLIRRREQFEDLLKLYPGIRE